DASGNGRSWVTGSPRGAVRGRLLAATMSSAAAQGRFEGGLLADLDSDAVRSGALRSGIALVAQRDERAARDALYRYVTDSALRAELEAMLERRSPQR